MKNLNKFDMKIDLQPYKNTSTSVYTGRPQGVQVREKLKLSTLDSNDEHVELIIPEDTTSFNPSFFLGLLFGSIQKLGLDKFKQKYQITIATKDPDLYNVIDSNIKDGFRNAYNSLNNKTGLNSRFSM